MKLINFKNKVNSYKGYGVVYSDDETPSIMDNSLYQEWSDERSDFFENAEIETIEQFLTWTVKHDPNYWHDLKNWAKEDEVSINKNGYYPDNRWFFNGRTRCCSRIDKFYG